MKKPPVHVTDHSVLRYLERVRGIDVEAVRTEIAAITEVAVQSGACGLNTDGMSYRFENGAVVTVTRTKSTNRAAPRFREADE